MLYRVIVNELVKTKIEYCDCKHCQGHYTDENLSFNELIDTTSKERAKERAIQTIYESGDYGELSEDQIKELHFVILEPGEKVLTRKAELELLDRWVNGKGLPDRPLETEYTYETQHV